MRLLLDTHALICWLNDNPTLTAVARAAVADPINDIFVSGATAWEIATKVRRGCLPEAIQVIADFISLLDAQEFEPLTVTTRQGLMAGGLLGDHNDPFDRMIAAQAIAEAMSVITIDPAIALLGATVVW